MITAPIENGMIRKDIFEPVPYVKNTLASTGVIDPANYQNVVVVWDSWPFFKCQKQINLLSSTHSQPKLTTGEYSDLRSDLEAIFSRSNERKAAKANHPLHAVAKDALARMKRRGKPAHDWSRRLAGEMTAPKD